MNKIGYLIKEGFLSIFTHGFMSFASICVIIACLVIMGSFSLLAVNIDSIIQDLEQQNQMVAFVDETLSEDDARALETQIREMPNVREVEFTTREQARENYVSQYEDSELFEDIDGSVFRHRYVVYLDDISIMEQTQRNLYKIYGIADVQAHLDVANGFITVRNVISIVSLALVVVLVIVSVFIMANTIKLTTYGRREEIIIMKNSFSESYKAAGVDVTAGYEGVRLMKGDVERTKIPGCISGIGGFGGLFQPDLTGMTEPVLVSGTDGVGTKLKIAFLMDMHDTVGIDCTAMCVNDIICVGAKPLFFLDYIACGKLIPERIAEIVAGVSEGCVQAGASLIGGETAEMPGFYPIDEYDLAGFAVGVVDKSKVLDKNAIKAGDVIIALPSSGVHSNGFSLVRKVFDVENADIKTPREELGGKSVGETLLTPTKIYVKPMLALFEEVKVKGVSHITGGGFYENIPRTIPAGLGAKIKKADIKILPIFDLIAKEGNIPERDMFNTYNMGVGMSVIVAKEDAQKAIEVLKANGEDAYIIGEVVKSEEGVIIE